MISSGEALVTGNTRRMAVRGLGQARGPPPHQYVHFPFPAYSCVRMGLVSLPLRHLTFPVLGPKPKPPLLSGLG